MVVCIEQSGRLKEIPTCTVNVIGLLLSVFKLPFKVSIQEHDASVLGKQAGEGDLLLHSLRPGVEHFEKVELVSLFVKMWNKTPC